MAHPEDQAILLQQAVAGPGFLAMQARSLIERGRLLPDDLQVSLLQREVEADAAHESPDVSLVYFLQAGAGGPIKIGMAVDPAARLAAIQVSHYADLSIVATTAGGGPVERAYHKRFAEHRIRGEWFARTPEIMAEIDRLQTVERDT